MATHTLGHERGTTISYTLTTDIPYYEPRTITMIFRASSRRPRLVKVLADGPRASRHRYRGGALCMWYPLDPADQRWTQRDGLLSLIEHARQHLFREAWWRETDEWLGPEVHLNLGDEGGTR